MKGLLGIEDICLGGIKLHALGVKFRIEISLLFLLLAQRARLSQELIKDSFGSVLGFDDINLSVKLLSFSLELFDLFSKFDWVKISLL